MTDHPIIFSAPMVRAIMAGRKTMTRRVLKPDAPPKWKQGDRLWVREAFRGNKSYNAKLMDWPTWPIHYEADGPPPPEMNGRLRSPRFMPRWASRLTLFVTDVRIEQLLDITPADVISEGVIDAEGRVDAIRAFHNLWKNIHGPGAWDENPLVAVISFTAHKGNINILKKEAPDAEEQ